MRALLTTHNEVHGHCVHMTYDERLTTTKTEREERKLLAWVSSSFHFDGEKKSREEERKQMLPVASQQMLGEHYHDGVRNLFTLLKNRR